MHPAIAIAVPPVGILIASSLDFDGLEKFATFTEVHRGFCVAVFFLWLIRSMLQVWVMQQHKSNAFAAAMMAVVGGKNGLTAVVQEAVTKNQDSE